MRISRRGEYALRAMTYLSLNYSRPPVPIHEIAAREKIPQKFLEQILLQLRKAGLLQSRRGVRGGYRLIKSPRRITLAEVIRTIDGPLAPVSCVSKFAHVACPDERKCNLRRVMLDVRNAIARVLESITFADVCLSEQGHGHRRRRP